MARWAVFGDSIAPDGSRTLRVSEGRVDSPLSDTGFLSTNDASGGTGGSPVVGIDGRIVGVLVDGNAAAAAGEFVYGAPGARTISVRFEALVDALADHPEAVTLLGELRLLDP